MSFVSKMPHQPIKDNDKKILRVYKNIAKAYLCSIIHLCCVRSNKL